VSHRIHHQRLCHFNQDKVAQTIALSADGSCICEVCLRAKSRAAAAPKLSRHPASEFGGRLFMDFDIVNVSSWNHKNIALVVVDEATRSVWTRYLTRKKSVYAEVADFISWFKTQYQRTIIRIRTDGEKVFTGVDFKNVLAPHGILHECITPHEHRQSGKVERVLQTLARITQAYLDASGAPRSMWTEGHAAAAYTYDFVIHPALGMSPYQSRTGKPPPISHLRVWGCLVWGFIAPERRKDNKLFSQRADSFILIGYGDAAVDGINRPGWRLWDPRKRTVVYAPVRAFEETRFPWKTGAPDSPPPEFSSTVAVEVSKFSISYPSPAPNAPRVVGLGTAPSPPSSSPSVPPVPSQVAPLPEEMREEEPELEEQFLQRLIDESEMEAASPSPSDVPAPGEPRYPRRERTPAVLHNVDRPEPRPKKGTNSVPPPKPPSEPFLQALAVRCAYSVLQVPTTIKEALASPQREQWIAAMKRELAKLKQRGTFGKLQAMPSFKNGGGRKPIGLRWVFKHQPGMPKDQEFKARLVVQGFSQRKDLDYDLTFSPTLAAHSLRVLLAAAAHERIVVDHWDVVSAFTNAKMDKEIYVKQPPGFELPGSEHLVLPLLSSLYGTKQSPRLWNDLISKLIIEYGFVQSDADPCIFVFRQKGSPPIRLGLFVDDMYVVCSDKRAKSKFYRFLSSKIELVDLGPLKESLGVEFLQTPGRIVLHQRKYARRVLERFGMLDCKTAPTPFFPQSLNVSQCPQSDAERAKLRDLQRDYRRACGSLIYLATLTRPDLSEAVRNVCQFMADPGTTHWQAVRRIFQYLSGTLDRCICYTSSPPSPLSPVVFADSDFANDKASRLSVSGGLALLCGAPVIWLCRTQRLVTLSTAEAETVALTDMMTEVIWLRRLLDDLGYPQPSPTRVLVDNAAAVAIANNEHSSRRTKHFDIRHKFNRQAIRLGLATVTHVPTDENYSDLFTKALPAERFTSLRNPLLRTLTLAAPRA
jgi:hypothetical protein